MKTLCTICLQPMQGDGTPYHAKCLTEFEPNNEPTTTSMMNNGLVHRERLLRKVKLTNDGGAQVAWIDIWYDQEGSRYVKSEDDRECDGKVHEDLKAAMQPFAEHFAIRCDQAKVKANYGFDGTAKGAEKCSISSVTFSGGVTDPENDDDGQPLAAHITCYTKWEGGGGATWCSPGMKPNAPNEKYKFTSELDAHIGTLEREAWAYLDGKIAPAPVDPQLSITDAIADNEADASILAIGEGSTKEEAMEAANTTPVDEED